MDSLISQGLGVCGCVVIFAAVYYTNVWNALQFPFLSQDIFSGTSPNASDAIVWNQTAVIGSDNLIDPAALAIEGLPWFATTYVVNILVTNLSVTAAIVHVFLWYPREMKAAFSIFSLSGMRKLFDFKGWNWTFWKNSSKPDANREYYDPHYKLMLAYPACPNWWYGLVLVLSFIIAMVILYAGHTTLPVRCCMHAFA